MEQLECFECNKKLVIQNNYDECEYCGKILCSACGVYVDKRDKEEKRHLSYHICNECYDYELEMEKLKYESR